MEAWSFLRSHGCHQLSWRDPRQQFRPLGLLGHVHDIVPIRLCGADLVVQTEKNPECVRGLLVKARYLTVISWLTYPGVYIIKMVGISGASACCYEQIGYSISDFVAKAVFGILSWSIVPRARTTSEENSKCIPLREKR